MINEKENPVAWALLLDGLYFAREHLGNLMAQMNEEGFIDDTEFRIQLGHVYAHLNRAWHSRDDQEGEITDEQWPLYSQFPKDIDPVG